jgi:hypothetical protein
MTPPDRGRGSTEFRRAGSARTVPRLLIPVVYRCPGGVFKSRWWSFRDVRGASLARWTPYKPACTTSIYNDYPPNSSHLAHDSADVCVNLDPLDS